MNKVLLIGFVAMGIAQATALYEVEAAREYIFHFHFGEPEVNFFPFSEEEKLYTPQPSWGMVDEWGNPIA
ncbi:MAG: hypothetical protein HY343_10905 [Lentisphaerae bacterium]|nr:hypothetical protein [Lentisphaerota bacterium]